MDGLSYDLLVLSQGAPPAEGDQDQLLAALEKDGRVALYLDFAPSRADLRPESRPVLDMIAELMKENPGLSLRVEGHTDDQGPAEANRALSLRRAQAVVQALVKAGLGAGPTPDRQ
jgi:outer membrane protein OmpA-like peptidoglycan-associated protein